MGRVMKPALILAAGWLLGLTPAWAQAPGGGAPPAVGVMKVALKPITETEHFIGRIKAINTVNLVARVTAYLEHIDFTEGREVKAGDTLYELEKPPFEADVAAKRGTVEQIQAQLTNADINLSRAQTLLNTPAGQQSNVDTAKANQGNLAGQLLAAQANLKTSQINLDYTTIKAPIDGKIGQTNVTVGNVVSPSSGTLATIVGQDPMYVLFPISTRSALELRKRYVGHGGFDAVDIKIRLPNNKIYGQTGKLNFVDNTISSSTDTILLRGTIPNPILPGQDPGGTVRELTDGEYIQVLLEGVQPIEVISIPRAAVSTDQQGNYVYVLADGNKAERRNVTLGQSTTTDASVTSGLKEGETIIVDGIQRVKPGQSVSPAPAAQTPAQQAETPGQ